MPPMVITSTTKNAALRPSAAHRSGMAVLGPGGPKSGRTPQTMATVTMNNAVSSSPGRNPARNSLPIDCSVRMP